MTRIGVKEPDLKLLLEPFAEFARTSAASWFSQTISANGSACTYLPGLPQGGSW